MLKSVPFAIGGTVAAALFALALQTPSAVAEAPKCKNKANKYVACTDKLRANPGRETAKGGRVEFEWKVEQGEPSKRRPGLKSGQ